MRHFKTLLFCLAALPIFANPSDRIVPIRGAVSVPTAPEAKLTVLSDPLHFESNQYTLLIGGDQHFSLDLKLETAQFGELQYADQSVRVWLEPGKMLEINFNGQDFFNTLSFSGEGGAANIFLKNFQKTFPELPQQIEAFMATADPDAYKKYILELAEVRRQFIETEANFKKAPADFQVLFSKNENYWTGFQLLRYAFDKPLFEGNWTPLNLSEKYYDFLPRLHVCTRGLLQSPDYVAFLEKYVDWQHIQIGNDRLDRPEVVKKYLTGEALWFFQAKDLALRCKTGKTDAAEICQFLTSCEHIGLASAVENIERQSRGIGAGMPAPNFGLTDVAGNLVSLSDLRGKVVFLDCWATWCGRCMDELPNLQRLTQNFDSEQVAVVFISFDKDPAAWKNTVQNWGLRGLHLWGEPLSNSMIGKMYGVRALPASFLIDQNGNIVKAGSGGTSVEEISRMIENLLKK